MKRFAVLFAVAALAACSTTPTTQDAARAPSAVQAPELLQASPGTGEVVVLRDRGLGGSGCLHQLKVDGRAVATLDNGEGVTLHLQPGQRLLAVEFGRGMCPNVALSAEPVVVAGQRMVYRISLPADGAARLTRVE